MKPLHPDCKRIHGARVAVAFGLGALLLIATPAAAVPILTYTVSGTAIKSSPGPDTLNLVGAAFAAWYRLDREAAPAFSSSAAGERVAQYIPESLEVSISNRPGAAPDVSFFINPILGIFVYNRFPPSSVADELIFRATGTVSSPIGLVSLGNSIATFNGQATIGGTLAAPLPLFDPSEVASFTDVLLQTGAGRYRIVDGSLRADLAEPGGIAMMMLGMAALWGLPVFGVRAKRARAGLPCPRSPRALCH